MKRGEILDSVKKTITQDRNNRHGEPENSFPRIAQVWTDYIDRLHPSQPGSIALKPSDVAEMLAMFKTVRFETQPDNPDNEHDRIGYYAIAAELRAAEREKVQPIMTDSDDEWLNCAYEKISANGIAVHEMLYHDYIISEVDPLPDNAFHNQTLKMRISGGKSRYYKFHAEHGWLRQQYD